jgi:hypothetical protein
MQGQCAARTLVEVVFVLASGGVGVGVGVHGGTECTSIDVLC